MTLVEMLSELLADGSVWRMRDLAAQGITASTVRRAVAAGTVEAISRGTYRRAGAPEMTGAAFAEAIARVPRGLICLLSAAELHELGDVTPTNVWLAIPYRSATPKLEWPPVRLVHWRGTAPFELGIEERKICGVQVRVTDPARTVIDMLRMRSTVGEDRALECLNEYVASGRPLAALRMLLERFRPNREMVAFVNGFLFGRRIS